MQRTNPADAPAIARVAQWPLRVIVLAIAAGLWGCATATPVAPMLKLSWPEPPEVARIEFLRVIRGAQDLGPERSAWEIVSGVSSNERGRSIVQPVDIAVTPDGSVVYVSDFAQGLIHVFDLSGERIRTIGEGLAQPFGVALDQSGQLWVAEQGKSQIRVLGADGETVRILPMPEVVRAVDLLLDESRGRVYVADGSRQHLQDHYVRIYDLDGVFLGNVGSGRGDGPGQLMFPTYLALDAEGQLYVSDTANGRVSVFDTDGAFVRMLGGRGDTFGMFDKPKGVAVDSFGNVYVVDSSWANVQIFGPSGDILLYFGGPGSYPGLLRNPTGIAMSSNNKIFVADYLNRRLSLYQLVNTKAGDGVPEATPPAISSN